MIDFVRRSAAGAAIAAGAVLAPAAIASAAVTVPFQINPAPFGNPNGILDVPSIRCWAVVGEQPGTVTITGPKDGVRACLLPGDMHWLNLSSGASGSARMSAGADGYPAAVLPTGAGQVVVAATSNVLPTTPGVVAVDVPWRIPAGPGRPGGRLPLGIEGDDRAQPAVVVVDDGLAPGMERVATGDHAVPALGSRDLSVRLAGLAGGARQVGMRWTHVSFGSAL